MPSSRGGETYHTRPPLSRLSPADGTCDAPTSRRHSGFADRRMRGPPGQSEATELTWRRTTPRAGVIGPDCQGEAELLLPNGDAQDPIRAPEASPGHLSAP